MPPAIARIESELGKLARDCAARIDRLNQPEAAAAFGVALNRMSSLRQDLVLAVNKLRFAGAQGPDALATVGAPLSVVSSGQILHAMDTNARRLTQVIAGLHGALNYRPQPLYAEEMSRSDPRAGQLAASERVFLALHRVVNPAQQDEGAVDRGCFADIPLPPSVFLAHAQAALRVGMAQGRGAMRFIDIGCGGGIKVLLAAEVFAQAVGLEYDPGYVEAARTALAHIGRPEQMVFQADALAFDGFGDFDVIYFYRPMQDELGMIGLERRIVEQVAPGTILIAPYPLFETRAADLGCAHIAGAVYVAGISAPEAAALHDRACATGISIASSGARTQPEPGYLAPLIEAARSFGFDLD